MSRARMLWVTEEVPDRDGGGGAIRQANLLVALAEDFDICLVVAGPVADRTVRSACTDVVEVAVPAPRPSPIPARVRTALDLWVRQRGLTMAGSAAAVAALSREVAARHRDHDIVVLNHEELLAAVPPATDRTALVVAHLFDVKSIRAEQSAAVASSRRQAAMWTADARVMRRFERRALATVDVVVTCAREDLEALEELAEGHLGAKGLVAPNGVDLERFTATPAPGAGRVLFFGSLHYAPNVDGVCWFARAVWPLVRADVPEATLSVVGHRPEPAVRALADVPGVEVVGDVPDAPPWYRSTDVVVVPLRVGTGTRLKALEAMACARPLVGTALGLAGLDLEDRGDGPARIADDAPGLAAAVIELLHDPLTAARLGELGRRHVEERFGWQGLARQLANGLTTASAARRDR